MIRWLQSLNPWARLRILEERMAGMAVCPSCGAVIVAAHEGTRHIEIKGERVYLCKWDHARLSVAAKEKLRTNRKAGAH